MQKVKVSAEGQVDIQEDTVTCKRQGNIEELKITYWMSSEHKGG